MSSASDFACHCLHHVLAVDVTPVLPHEATESFLLELARKNADLLISALNSLPTEMASDSGPLAELPKVPSFPIPRLRRLPEAKAETRWEAFAREQGIRKHRKKGKVWDAETSAWRPRFGRASAKNVRQRAEEAIIEVRPGETAEEALEARRKGRKLERSKQKIREIRNKVNAAKKRRGEETG